MTDRPNGQRKTFTRRSALASIGMAAALSVLGGCAAKDPPTGDIRGEISYESKPVTEGNVIFENTDRGWLRVAPLDAEGQYRLDDMKVAEYKVSVQPPDPKLPNETSGIEGKITITPEMFPNPANIPRRFRDSQTTPLKATVVEGSNRFDFDLSKP